MHTVTWRYFAPYSVTWRYFARYLDVFCTLLPGGILHHILLPGGILHHILLPGGILHVTWMYFAHCYLEVFCTLLPGGILHTVTWRYFAHRGRMPAVPLVAVRTLHEHGVFTQTLSEHFPSNVIQPHSFAWKIQFVSLA